MVGVENTIKKMQKHVAYYLREKGKADSGWYGHD